jgi:hypothetical protein
MPHEPLPPYLEIRQQIDELVVKLAELRAKENEMLRQMLSDSEQPEVMLQFDDRNKTIMWFDKSLKLGSKSYLFVKMLWYAPRHRKKIESLEQSVWKPKFQKHKRLVAVKTKNNLQRVRVASRFISQNTLKLFLFRLQKRLRLALFPYKISPIKDRKSGEIVGYGLKCTKRYMKIIKKVP